MICSRCKIRTAIVFVTRIDKTEQKQEGLCIKCAKDLGIKPVTDMINKMGLGDEELDQLSEQMGDLLNEQSLDDVMENLPAPPENDDTTAGAPPFDIKQLFMNGPGAPVPNKAQNNAKAKGKDDQKPERKFLNMYCIDLTARAGSLDKIIGREAELARTIQILCRRQKNNPCLIGEPGVGKTALAEALAQRIAEGRIPYRLLNKEVFVLDLTSLVAGTQFRGQFENRMRGLIEEVKKLGNIILVIDEIHTIVGAGDAEGGMNAANILKPALSRGEIQVIGATTLAEYRKYIEKDSALERRFQPVIINEPSIADSIEILKGIKGYYERFHGIKIPDSMTEKTVIFSERYITERFLPDKAIDLLDEACAYVSLNNRTINRLDELKVILDNLKAEKEKLEAIPEPDDGIYAKIADAKVKEINLMEEYGRLSTERDGIALNEGDLAKVIEVWTGIPASNITENEFLRINGLDERLKKRIVGQDGAIEAICKAIKRSRAGISYKRKPVSFIFAGPTGVGKTELVKTLANDLFDSPEALIRLDMSEFMEKHSVSRIIGAPPGYVGYDEAGQLTEKIRRKPYSVILFDEIEKAHPDVMNILLQILDDGRITDAHGKEVNFENTVIVMTTNAGSGINTNLSGFSTTRHNIDSEKTAKALGEFLRPEFINRVDEIITFNRLGIEQLISIAKIQLNDLSRVLAQKGVTLDYTLAAAEFIAKKSYSDKYGARNLRRYIQSNIEDKIANDMINSYDKHIERVTIDAGDELSVKCL